MLAAPLSIPVRNAKFPMDDVPRYWHGGRRSLTLFLNNLSVFFPEGERFFIESVKAFDAHIEDPELRRQVRAFVAQEGMHTREHLRYNRMLKDQGYPVERMEKRVAALLKRVRRRSEARHQLAVTCALEHFTATLAHVLLSNPGLFEGADSTMAQLWRWHAIEETEHKSVAFDVFESLGGNHPERVVAMLGATVIFLAKVFEHQWILMKRDGIQWSPREWGALVRFLFVSPGGLGSALPLYLEYFSPRFHPWQHDNREVVERARRTFEAASALYSS